MRSIIKISYVVMGDMAAVKVISLPWKHVTLLLLMYVFCNLQRHSGSDISDRYFYQEHIAINQKKSGEENYNFICIKNVPSLLKLRLRVAGRSSPEVECWTSDHWVVGSKPLRGMFHD